MNGQATLAFVSFGENPAEPGRRRDREPEIPAPKERVFAAPGGTVSQWDISTGTVICLSMCRSPRPGQARATAHGRRPHDNQVRAVVRRPGENQITRADAVGTVALRTGGDAVPG